MGIRKSPFTLWAQTVGICLILPSALFAVNQKAVRSLVDQCASGNSKACSDLERIAAGRSKEAGYANQQLAVLQESRAREETLHQLADPESNVRRQAACELDSRYNPTNIYPNGRPTPDTRYVEPLLNLLADPDRRTRECAASALGEIKDTRAVRDLKAVLCDPHSEIQDEAAWALARIASPEAVDALIAGTEVPHSDLSRYAVAALANMGDPRAILALITFLERNDRGADMAAMGLGKVRDPRAVTALLPVVSDLHFDRWTRENAYCSLILQGQAGTESELIAALDENATGGMCGCALNSENRQLEEAARSWAKTHHVQIGVSLESRDPGPHGWGSAK